MGIIIDILVIAVIILSTFLGYKKGLVKLGTKLVAGIIAIVITIIVYKPVTALIINKTQIDENIAKMIIENTQESLKNNEDEKQNILVDNISKEIIPGKAESISKSIIYAFSGSIIFIIVKFILGFIISLLNIIAKLPILKQFNELGGIIYGIIRGIIIGVIFIVLVGTISSIKPQSYINETFESSYIAKMVYNKIIIKK